MGSGALNGGFGADGRTDSHEHNARRVHYSINIGWRVVTYVLKGFAVRVFYASSGWWLGWIVTFRGIRPILAKIKSPSWTALP